MSRTIDVSGLHEERPLGVFNYRVIALSWLITAFDGFDMMLIGFTGPYMRDELGFSASTLGHLISVGVFVMLLGVQKLLIWLLPPKTPAAVPATAVV